MIVIGLTGGIGTGKTHVSGILSDLGATVINADLVGHEAYLPNTETWQVVVDTFGKEILTEDNEIDRRALGGIVFSDPKQLERLNAIMHPRIFDMIRERIVKLEGEGIDKIVVEAALLIEANWTPLATEVWVLTSDGADVVQRLLSRSNMTEETIKARIDSQLPQDERVTHADVVIENDGDLNRLRERVETVWRERASA
ncbi:MAG: dephospho-CoA kinase [SAR202 cluster bacterium]|jgi:dephospho-CoA kinase|nr:dephospho-CoA kinase [SAR202 cluster bacterium]MDP6715585.1 dephospho-CoA kinase [SAR202 cluster bacterium]